MKRLFSFVALSALLVMVIAGCSKSPVEPEEEPVAFFISPQLLYLTQADSHGEITIRSGNGGYTIYKLVPMFCTILPAGGTSYTFDPAKAYQVSIVGDQIIIDRDDSEKRHCATTFLVVDRKNQRRCITIEEPRTLGNLDGGFSAYSNEIWVWDDPVFPKK